ncbi:hypothetical protein BX600DRAFT_206142 [Xylariales sp. PMI_506]|nr:hypothetical protein BX600DRAFT_206142 [Xylariales sp. PMI_506]
MDALVSLPLGLDPSSDNKQLLSAAHDAEGSLQCELDLSPQLCWKSQRFSQRRLNAHANRINRQRKAARTWVHDSDDGAALARSKARLPSDGDRRKPRLERQEAFRISQKTVYAWDVVENDAELYRMGILYDDDYARGSGFDLNAIVHPEPVYAIRTPKRTPSAAGKRRSSAGSGSDSDDEAAALLPLLDLSFASLDVDLVLAQLLASPHPDDTQSWPETDEVTHFQASAESAPVTTSYRSTPLHVIYELREDSIHSLAPLPAADIFPDLVSDSEGEEEDSSDWDLVPLLQREDSDRSALAIIAEGDEEEEEEEEEEDADDASAAAEAWIVLGET